MITSRHGCNVMDKPYHVMTLAECAQFGQSVAQRCTGAFEVDGRVITNVEMHAVAFYKLSERRKAKQFLEDEL